MCLSWGFPSVLFVAFLNLLPSFLRVSPSLGSWSCLLHLCDFSLDNRIHSQGFSSYLSAAFPSLPSSGLHFQLPVEWTCLPGCPASFFPNLTHQVSSLSSLVLLKNYHHFLSQLCLYIGLFCDYCFLLSPNDCSYSTDFTSLIIRAFHCQLDNYSVECPFALV